MKVLVVGSGGREHALCTMCTKSLEVSEVFVAPGNPGMKKSLPKLNIVNIEQTQVEELLNFALNEKIFLTIVGPEVSLAAGIVDEFRKNKLLIIGPTLKASQLESSKTFAKEIMKKANVPTANYQEFFSSYEAISYIESLPDQVTQKMVIKCDGLAQGKGVIVCLSKSEGVKAVNDLMINKILGFDVSHIIIEDFLEGSELSAFALCDGEDFTFFGTACDHKRLRNNDQGPNTGGMGVYSPANSLDEMDIQFINEKIFLPTLKTMKDEGVPFTGILFAGLMKTKLGIKVIEFNVRLGDPESQALLPLIEDDMVDWFLAAAKCQLKEFKKVSRKTSPKFKNMKAVHVVMAAYGYPGTEGISIRSGDDLIFSPEFNLSPNDYLFYAGVMKNIGHEFLQTKGGRILGVTSLAETYTFARSQAYNNISKIQFEGAQYRSDIGQGLV
ncbi:MAG: phosphoribosylamine--glycine ligase [Bacteriovoracaceae bacterium]|nr:phosphoribosylamine--glycine ligase [Bacteriovoracaceae bacterium]